MRRHFERLSNPERRIMDDGITRRNETTRNEAYKQIKPETNITVEECNNFWDNLFASMESQERALKEADELPDEITLEDLI